MKIIVDAFGGDNAPAAVIEACRAAADEYGAKILLTGFPDRIAECARELGISISDFEIIPAQTAISMEDEPTEILKSHKDSSMAVGLKKLAEGAGDAFVSAGSTGALTVGGTMYVKRLPGIKRAAIGALIPNLGDGYLLVDTGANDECRPEMLLQFAAMGSAYMNRIRSVKNPRVGLVNIGSERTKGTELQLKTYELLEKADINFIGNIEANGLPTGGCDVAVCDGFTGNVVLKTTEGMGKMFSALLKQLFESPLGKLGGLAVLGKIKALRGKMNPSAAGGAPLLGLRAPVIKAHGGSDADAIKNAVRQAMHCVESDVTGEIARAVSSPQTSGEPQAE